MQLIMAVPQINILECLFFSPQNQEIGVSSKQTTDHKKKVHSRSKFSIAESLEYVCALNKSSRILPVLFLIPVSIC